MNGIQLSMTMFSAPSPLKGEGWGEGVKIYVMREHSRLSPLSLTLSLKGRGNRKYRESKLN